jgi:hypothetical protein
VVVGLRGNDLLLNLRQRQLRSASVRPKLAISPRPSGRLIGITSKLRD